jgi:hypothetical protein
MATSALYPVSSATLVAICATRYCTRNSPRACSWRWGWGLRVGMGVGVTGGDGDGGGSTRVLGSPEHAKPLQHGPHRVDGGFLAGTGVRHGGSLGEGPEGLGKVPCGRGQRRGHDSRCSWQRPRRRATPRASDTRTAGTPPAPSTAPPAAAQPSPSARRGCAGDSGAAPEGPGSGGLAAGRAGSDWAPPPSGRHAKSARFRS